MKNVVWFSEVDKNDVNLVGGKGANLGELYKLNINIPNGFIITSQAYFESLASFGTLDRIRAILYDLDIDNPENLQSKALACQNEILKISLDKNLEHEIKSFYKKLSGRHDLSVAVRSSATAEDLPQASFAGQQSTFLNIKGVKELKKAVLSSWASLFEARAIFYRSEKKFDHFKVGIAVPIQKMVESEVSGVMFTIDPVTNDKSTIVIEAIYGLGELIVEGSITPDHYEISKNNFSITQKNIVRQDKQLTKGKNGNKLLQIAEPYQQTQKLEDEKIVELAKIGSLIEKHYFFPQDIEWAYENNTIYIVQTRPVTTLKKQKNEEKLVKSAVQTDKNEIILQGSPASPVIATGPVVIIKSPKELNKIHKGDVLVTEMTNPDFVPGMKKAVAVITDKGGRTSHAAIVSRELGIACVVGTENATKKLHDGMVVTVDGAKGIIYKGQIIFGKKTLTNEITSVKVEKHYKTATKLYVNLAEPDLAFKVASRNVDGVGLLRADFILSQIGKHPKQFLEEGKGLEFTEKLASSLSLFGKAFGKRPVVYRATDLKSNEYRNLTGGDKFEPKEANPMLGYRGAFRFIKDPDVFKLELAAIKKVRQKYPNIHLMIPFVRTVKELISVKKIIGEFGLLQDSSLKLWMMVEIPSNIILLEDFIKTGIDGISIGSNDLTMLILGTDRDNEEVASEFYELDEAVLWALESAVKTAVKAGITSSICGQAPSVYPELTQKLINWGITSISVNPDVLGSTRQIIYECEKKLIAKGKINLWQR